MKESVPLGAPLSPDVPRYAPSRKHEIASRMQKGRPGATPDGLLCDCRLKLRFRRDGSRLQ